MKLEELKKRMLEYYSRDITPPYSDTEYDYLMDPAVVATPQIDMSGEGDDMENIEDMETVFAEEVEIQFINEEGEELLGEDSGNMFFEDEEYYYFFEADDDKDGIDDSEDDYDAEDDVYPDDDMEENLKEYKLITKVKQGQKIRVLPPKKGFKRIGGKYEKMTPQEQKALSKVAKKGWKKKKPKIAQINKAKAKSMKRRKTI